MVETDRAKSHPCYHTPARIPCPGDVQSAYEVQAARSVTDFKNNKLIWSTGRIKGAEQRVTFGGTLGSRDVVAWRVRVWDANGKPSQWSEPASWSMGLIDQGD